MPQNRTRHEIKKDRVDSSINQLRHEIYRRLNEKGNGTFSSSHEILGIITEEYQELIEAIKLHGDNKSDRIKSELLDISVACIFGAACIDEGEMDWL